MKDEMIWRPILSLALIALEGWMLGKTYDDPDNKCADSAAVSSSIFIIVILFGYIIKSLSRDEPDKRNIMEDSTYILLAIISGLTLYLRMILVNDNKIEDGSECAATLSIISIVNTLCILGLNQIINQKIVVSNESSGNTTSKYDDSDNEGDISDISSRFPSQKGLVLVTRNRASSIPQTVKEVDEESNRVIKCDAILDAEIPQGFKTSDVVKKFAIIDDHEIPEKDIAYAGKEYYMAKLKLDDRLLQMEEFRTHGFTSKQYIDDEEEGESKTDKIESSIRIKFRIINGDNL